MVIRFNAFNRKLKNRPAKVNLDNNRIRHRERTIFSPEIVNYTIQTNLTTRFALINLFPTKRPINKLINVAYNINKFA